MVIILSTFAHLYLAELQLPLKCLQPGVQIAFWFQRAPGSVDLHVGHMH